MKSNFENLTAFAEEIDRREKAKQDYLVPTLRLNSYEDKTGETDYLNIIQNC